MKSWRRTFKLLCLCLRHGIFIAYWSFYDVALTISTRLRKKDYIGVYVKIISPSEIALLFTENDVGWAYAGYTLIKVGFNSNWFTEDDMIDILVHETLHQVLRARVSEKANEQLDNIHKLLSYSFNKHLPKLWKIGFVDNRC